MPVGIGYETNQVIGTGAEQHGIAVGHGTECQPGAAAVGGVLPGTVAVVHASHRDAVGIAIDIADQVGDQVGDQGAAVGAVADVFVYGIERRLGDQGQRIEALVAIDQADIVAVEHQGGVTQGIDAGLGDGQGEHVMAGGIDRAAADGTVIAFQRDQQLAAGERHAAGGGGALHQGHADDVLVDADVRSLDQGTQGAGGRGQSHGVGGIVIKVLVALAEHEAAGVEGDIAHHGVLLHQGDALEAAAEGVLEQEDEAARGVVARGVGTEDEHIFLLDRQAVGAGQGLVASGGQQQVAGQQVEAVGAGTHGDGLGDIVQAIDIDVAITEAVQVKAGGGESTAGGVLAEAEIRCPELQDLAVGPVRQPRGGRAGHVTTAAQPQAGLARIQHRRVVGAVDRDDDVVRGAIGGRHRQCIGQGFAGIERLDRGLAVVGGIGPVARGVDG